MGLSEVTLKQSSKHKKFIGETRCQYSNRCVTERKEAKRGEELELNLLGDGVKLISDLFSWRSKAGLFVYTPSICCLSVSLH